MPFSIQPQRYGVSPPVTGPVNSRPKTAPQVRFGLSFDPMLPLVMLESSMIAQLAVTDLGAMVVPRTLIEWKKRGKVAAAEAFAREIAGTVTNTFLMGVLGLGLSQFFRLPSLNPKGMDFSRAAHIDATMLGHFEGITKRLLEENEGKNIPTAQFKQEFLKAVFGQICSTDHVAEYAEKQLKIFGVFPKDGKLTPSALNKIITAYETKMLNEAALSTQKGRLAAVQQLRKTQAKARQNFITELLNHAVGEGKITERVFMNEKNDARDLSNVLETTRNYMEEFLNRALHETKLHGATLTDEGIVTLRKALFAEGGNNIWQRHVRPLMTDGLVRYAYKTKKSTVLIPFALTMILGCSFVFVKNWITRLRTHIKNFPGEESLRNQEELRNGLIQNRPVYHGPPPPWQTPQQAAFAPRFKGFTSSAPALTRMLDFQSMGVSTVFQNMVIYAGVIASRIIGARGHNEKAEVERQDLTGYYNWFFGTSLIQVGIVSSLMMLMFPPARELLITPMLKSARKSVEGVFSMFFKPNSVWKIATRGQLQNRLAQLNKAMESTTLSESAKANMKKLQGQLGWGIFYRPLLFGVSILLSSLSLGIAIPSYNVWRTRANIRKQMHPQQPSVAFQHPAPYPRIQPAFSQTR